MIKALGTVEIADFEKQNAGLLNLVYSDIKSKQAAFQTENSNRII